MGKKLGVQRYSAVVKVFEIRGGVGNGLPYFTRLQFYPSKAQKQCCRLNTWLTEFEKVNIRDPKFSLRTKRKNSKKKKISKFKIFKKSPRYAHTLYFALKFFFNLRYIFIPKSTQIRPLDSCRCNA